VALCLALLLAALVSPLFGTQLADAQSPEGVLVYHQITNLTDGSGSVGFPVLSADGTRAVFVDAPGTGDAATPNRIFVIGFDGSGQTEVDAYQSLCYCTSLVDISNDGATVISTDSVQVRIAGAGSARALITLASNEITSIALSGDGQTVFFLVRRDTVSMDGATTLARGIWAIDADGTNLRHLISADAIAAITGVPVAETGCCFHADGHPLAVSDDGGRLVFGAFGGGAEHVFTAAGDSGDLRLLREGAQSVSRVAISGDGATAAYEVILPEGGATELGVVPVDGGPPALTAQSLVGYSYHEPLQLTADGGLLLVSPDGLLIERASGKKRLLATAINGAGGNHEAVLTDGLARGTMDAEGRRFLYAMRTVRCADCANLHEQLATLEIDPDDAGEAPQITRVDIEPTAIALERGSQTTTQATVVSSHRIVGVGFAALREGTLDVNVGHLRNLLDDGMNGDLTAGDGTYTAAGIDHASIVARDNDAGPRMIRIAAEVEDATGLRHASATDSGTLMVGEQATPPGTATATG
jgi:hypothetical protein